MFWGKRQQGEEKEGLMNSSGELMKFVGESGNIGEQCWKFFGLTKWGNWLIKIVLLKGHSPHYLTRDLFKW